MKVGAAELRQPEKPIRTRALSLGKSSTFGAALLTLLVFLNGCAGLVSGPSGNTTQPSSSSLQLSPGTVSFGRVGLGKQSTQTISVLNPNQGHGQNYQDQSIEPAIYSICCVVAARASVRTDH